MRKINREYVKVVAAMSGGVDSSVSAALLKREGYDVTGVFMKCWDPAKLAFPKGASADRSTILSCTSEEDEKWARRSAAKIEIPFYSVDFVKEYSKRVVDYFVEEYRNGRTPNPDVMCNREIKFGVFYDWAVNDFGADFVATGHYARVVGVLPSGSFLAACGRLRGARWAKQGSMLSQPANPPEGNTPATLRLLKGKDSNKDQSYFLWAVKPEKFKKVIFPVGGYLKSETRELAREFGLPNAERKDSQGICFIGNLNVASFLSEFIPNKPGPIVNTKGETVGGHKGLHYYTIGQRKRINIGGGPPYYVWAKDYDRNALLVSREFDDELFGGGVSCSNVNWISKTPDFPYRCKVKIRYRQEDQDAIINSINKDGSLNVEFSLPQRAVTPGQSIVFYKDEELVGGGIIKGLA